MVLLRYYLRFKGEDAWTEVGGFVHTQNSVPFDTNLCSTAWKSVTNKASFQLVYTKKDTELYSSIITRLTEAQKHFGERVECMIKNNIDGETMFIGYVDLGKFSVTTGRLPEKVSITAEDHIILLDEKVKYNHVMDGVTVEDVINWLLRKAGLTQVEQWDDGIRTRRIELPFVSTEDEDKTYREYIDTILQEYGGYVLVSNPMTGGFNVRKVNHEDVHADESSKVTYLVQSKLKSDATRFPNDGVVVKYSNVKTSASNHLIYFNANLSEGKVQDPGAKVDENGDRDTSGDGTKVVAIGEVVAKDGFFPVDSDVTKTYWEYDPSLFDTDYLKKKRRTQNQAMGIYYVKPNSITMDIRGFDKDDNPVEDWYENIELLPYKDRRFTYPAGGEWHPRKAWQILHNKSDKVINVKHCALKGSAVYSDQEYRLVMPPTCTDPFEYESSYISTEPTALAFATFLMNLKKFGGNTSQWTGRWGDHQIGQKVWVEHKDSVGFEAVVVKKSMKVIGSEMWCDYVAVSVSEWMPMMDYESSTSAGHVAPVTAYQQWLVEGNVGTYQDYLDSMSFSYEYMWSSSPDYVDPDSHIFTFSGKFILVKGVPVGDFKMQDWSKIVEARTEEKPFLWCRVNKGTPFRVTGEIGPKGEDGDDAKVWDIIAPGEIYTKDRRTTGDIDIELKADVQGYPYIPKWVCSSDKAHISLSFGKVVTLTIDADCLDVITVTMYAEENTDVTASKKFTPMDVTQHNQYLGDSLDGVNPIVGDCYYDPTVSLLKVKTGNGDDDWTPLNESGLSLAQISDYCSKAQKDVLSKITPGTVLSADYGYFNTIIANCVTANYIGAQEIVLRKLEDGREGSISSEGYVEGGTSGFKIRTNGSVSFYEAEIGGSSTFNGDFDCGVIKTEKLKDNEYSGSYTPITYQASNIKSWLKNTVNLGKRNKTPCSSSLLGPRVKYISWTGEYGYDYIYFYDENFNILDVGSLTTVTRKNASKETGLLYGSEGYWQEYVYTTNTLDLKVYSSASRLWVDVPITSNGLAPGMLYMDSNGFLKVVKA